MPRLDGLEATRQIIADPRLAQVRVIILTTFDLDDYVYGALRAGASGFLVKDTEPAELIHAVRVVARGDALIAPSVTRKLIAEFASRVKRPEPGPSSTRSPSGSGRSWGWSRAGCPTTRSRPGWCSARPRPRRTSAGS